ncbi:MAG: biopolymer transporter ExbD [Methylacidiphilales bacterium]|nr:biopolymer transporter ExbD [Candidatus Methylacidiphilales bacterium]
MKIISPLPTRRGRLEIIPLIDIMFFLLAAFMLVSIDKIRVKSLKVNLPTNVPTAQIEKKEDFLSVSVNTDGQVQLEKDLIKDKQTLLARLQQLYVQNKDQKFLISADKDARNGDVIAVLGELRAAGFQKVAFSICSTTEVPGSAQVPPLPSALGNIPGSPVSAPALAPPPDVPAEGGAHP